jgi:hypothetical protein
MSFQLGIINWIIVASSIILIAFKKIKKIPEIILFLGILIYCLFMATSSSLPIWEEVIALPFIQYPWRFLSMATFCVAVISAFVATSIDKYNKNKRTVIFLISFAIIFLTNAGFVNPSTYLNLNSFDLSSIKTSPPPGFEPGYLPIFVKKIDSKVPDSLFWVVSGQSEVKVIQDLIIRKESTIVTESESVVRASVHYFPGWIAELDQKEVEINFDNSQGYMDIKIPKGKHTLTLQFVNTKIRTIGEVVTSLTIALLFSFKGANYLIKLRHKRRIGRIN